MLSQPPKLVRPAPEDVDLVVRAVFESIAHPPWSSPEEMRRALLEPGPAGDWLGRILLLIVEERLEGVILLAAVEQSPVIVGFGLLPPWVDGNDEEARRRAVTLVRWTVRELRSRFPALEAAAYEEPLRAIFEAAGFVTYSSMLRFSGPVAPSAPLEGAPPLRSPEMGDADAIGELLALGYGGRTEGERRVARALARGMLDGTGERLLREASFVAPGADGAIDGVVLVTLDETGRRVSISHAVVRPGAQGHGLGATLIQACMNGLRAAGFEQLHSWSEASNRPILRIQERFGMSSRGPVRHQGALSPTDPAGRYDLGVLFGPRGAVAAAAFRLSFETLFDDVREQLHMPAGALFNFISAARLLVDWEEESGGHMVAAARADFPTTRAAPASEGALAVYRLLHEHALTVGADPAWRRDLERSLGWPEIAAGPLLEEGAGLGAFGLFYALCGHEVAVRPIGHSLAAFQRLRAGRYQKELLRFVDSIGENQYAATICVGSEEALADPEGWADRAWRALRPGGLLLLALTRPHVPVAAARLAAALHRFFAIDGGRAIAGHPARLRRPAALETT